MKSSDRRKMVAYLQRSIDKTNASHPLTHETVKTDVIITIKKLTIKLNSIAELIRTKNTLITPAKLLSIDAELEMIVDELDDIMQKLK